MYALISKELEELEENSQGKKTTRLWGLPISKEG
jgi:hypothetical protein